MAVCVQGFTQGLFLVLTFWRCRHIQVQHYQVNITVMLRYVNNNPSTNMSQDNFMAIKGYFNLHVYCLLELPPSKRKHCALLWPTSDQLFCRFSRSHVVVAFHPPFVFVLLPVLLGIWPAFGGWRNFLSNGPSLFHCLSDHTHGTIKTQPLIGRQS